MAALDMIFTIRPGILDTNIIHHTIRTVMDIDILLHTVRDMGGKIIKDCEICLKLSKTLLKLKHLMK